MKITIRYHAQARQAVGRAEEVIETAGPMTMRRLMCDLAERHGERMRAMLLTGTGEPHLSLLLFVGDQQSRSDSKQPLGDGAEVGLFSPIAGG